MVSTLCQKSKIAILIATLLMGGAAHSQESPPQSSPGVIEDPTLVANQDLAKAQAVGAITSFMTQGATQCDSDGSNCRSLFGADDNMDMASMQLSTKGVTGVETFAFSGEDNSSNSVASQVGDFAIACGFTTPEVHSVSGIAVKVHDCTVNTAGNASARVQVCTAPARSLPIKNPENAIQCSTNPADPNYTAPNGFTCWVPACDDMPEGTLNGWSPVHDISFTASMSETASDSEKSNNGLALIFYPPLDGSQPKDFKTDSETMTAVKLLQSFVDTETKKTAVGFRVAYRYKSQVTKEMLAGEAGSINPNDHSSQWETIEKLQGNALIPQYQKEFAANGSECLQQIQQGIASDGIVYVCDTQYTNESGIRPLEIKAQIAAEGQDCSSTTQCLKEVLNTNTWKEMCHSEAPLSLRKCTTTQDYTMETLSWVRTRNTEICTETRLKAQYSCTTSADPINCQIESVISSGGLDLSSGSSDANIVYLGAVDNVTNRYRIGTIGDNYWGTGYYRREFVIDIRDVSEVKTFRMYHVGFDDLMAVGVNNQWAWADYGAGSYHPQYDQWGRIRQSCPDEGPCYEYLQNRWERSTNWNYGVNVNLIPLLREGRNVLRIDTGVVGGGEGWVFLEISAWKARCDYIINNGCGGYENAQ